jgi:hypothetical protein
MANMKVKDQNFLSSIQNSLVKQPTQIGFSTKKWDAFFKQFENHSEEDKKIYEAGLWFFDCFARIRELLSKYNDKVVDLYILRQSYVSIINRDFLVAKMGIEENIDSSDDKKVLMGQLSEMKLPIGPENFDVHILGALETSVSGIRFPLSQTFQKEKLSIKNKISDLDFLNVLFMNANLASLYHTVTQLWGDCLWNGWYMHSNKNMDVIVPPMTKEHVSRVVSLHRRELLEAEFVYHTITLWADMHKKLKEMEINKIRIISTKRIGKRKRFILGKYKDEEKILAALSMSITAEELYWNEVLLSSLPNIPILTVREIIEAWDVLFSLGNAIYSKLPEDTGVKNITKLLQFAPKFKKKELINSIRKITGFSYEKSVAVIDLCTFSGNVREDPWIKPIIPLKNNNLTFLIPALTVTNRIRLIESWMKEGGIDLAERGSAFENHARSEIKNYSKRSKYLSKTFVSDKPVILKNDVEEEVDFVWIIGSLVIIGEIKCSFFPSNPIEVHNYFELLNSATIQVKRKAEFVNNNLPLFYETLAIDNPQNYENIIVYPFVLVNLPFGAGFLINDIAVTDLRILIRYIEGYQDFFVSLPSNKNKKPVKKNFYDSEKESEDNFISYIEKPPIIDLYEKLIDKELVPLIKFEEQEIGSGFLRLFVDESKLKPIAEKLFSQ